MIVWEKSMEPKILGTVLLINPSLSQCEELQKYLRRGGGRRSSLYVPINWYAKMGTQSNGFFQS